MNDQLQSYIKIERFRDVHHSLFIPESNRLLVYREDKTLYEYNVPVEGTYSALYIKIMHHHFCFICY